MESARCKVVRRISLAAVCAAASGALFGGYRALTRQLRFATSERRLEPEDFSLKISANGELQSASRSRWRCLRYPCSGCESVGRCLMGHVKKGMCCGFDPAT
jgi:hypothetical protein